jgi:N-acetyl-anhydromuramyl-L-alanine amidase AmpD
MICAVLILAPALFLSASWRTKWEKKVEFKKIQKITETDNNITSENTDLENLPENNSPENNNDSSIRENKAAQENDNKIEDENKKSEPVSVAKITNRLVSWGYEKADSRKIDTIIVHSTYNITSSDPFDLDAIIYKEYKPYGVSPHYIINRDGKIYRLVEDKNIAYHAGESKMPDGRTGVNNFSIGIELVNSKTAKPTDEQYASLKYLIGYIKGKYSIKYTLGHKDIASGRKDDPWNFDWGKI